MKLSNIYLHGSVTNPDFLADLMLSTGLVAIQSTREKNKIIMVTPEDALLKMVCHGVEYHTGGDYLPSAPKEAK